MKTGFRFTFPDADHVAMTAVTPAGELSLVMTWEEFVEIHKAVMQRRRERVDLRACPVEVGEEAEGEP